MPQINNHDIFLVLIQENMEPHNGRAKDNTEHPGRQMYRIQLLLKLKVIKNIYSHWSLILYIIHHFLFVLVLQLCGWKCASTGYVFTDSSSCKCLNGCNTAAQAKSQTFLFLTEPVFRNHILMNLPRKNKVLGQPHGIQTWYSKM